MISPEPVAKARAINFLALSEYLTKDLVAMQACNKRRDVVLAISLFPRLIDQQRNLKSWPISAEDTIFRSSLLIIANVMISK